MSAEQEREAGPDATGVVITPSGPAERQAPQWKASTSCRICFEWVEGAWNRATEDDERGRLQTAMDRGWCDKHLPQFVVGDRVRHAGRIYSREAFATVLEIVGPYRDGAYELRVKLDEGAAWLRPGTERWWPSYYTEHGR